MILFEFFLQQHGEYKQRKYIPKPQRLFFIKKKNDLYSFHFAVRITAWKKYWFQIDKYRKYGA